MASLVGHALLITWHSVLLDLLINQVEELQPERSKPVPSYSEPASKQTKLFWFVLSEAQKSNCFP